MTILFTAWAQKNQCKQQKEKWAKQNTDHFTFACKGRQHSLYQFSIYLWGDTLFYNDFEALDWHEFSYFALIDTKTNPVSFHLHAIS